MEDANNNLSSTPLAGLSGDTPMRAFSVLQGWISSASQASPWTIGFTILASLIAYDQITYILNKGSIAGPSWKIPFMGPFLSSINPKFSEYVDKWNSGPLSCVSVFHKFVVIAADRDLARKVFNSPSYVTPCIVDIAHKLFGSDSWVFMSGKEHLEFRKGLNPLFTRRALQTYLPGQEEVLDRYIARFARITADAGNVPVPFMPHFREVMCAVSLRTFTGSYLPDETIQKIARDYYNITAALELVNFPVIIPYTRTWRGKKAADMVLAEFSKASAKSKARMAAGAQPACLMDEWVHNMLASQTYIAARDAGHSTEGLEKPVPLVRVFSDYEVAQTVFTFLFAAQDATSSAATWLFQIMAQRPEVLERVREENLRVRGGDVRASVDLEQLEGLKYTRAVVRELLRYRSPVIMVPYETKKPFPITDGYTVPKGAMIAPSTYLALTDPAVYTNPHYFDPERYYSGDAEEKGAKNYLVFGAGPHYCIGQHYAQLNLVLFLGKASMLLDWEHHATPLSEEIQVFATIFPQDHCPMTFTERKC